MYVPDLLQACDDAYSVCDVTAGPDGRDGALVQHLHSGDVLIAFRGTQSQPNAASVWDWINDLRAELVEAEGFPGRVHAGFLDSLNALWSGLFDALERPALTAEEQAKLPWNKSLWITGHSKGGALAQLAGCRLAALKPTVVTFAAPMVGDLDFSGLYPDDVNVTRYESAHDIVPHLPPLWYRAVGKCVHEVVSPEQPYLRSIYQHRLRGVPWEQIVQAHQISTYRAWLSGQSPRVAS